MIDTVIGGNFDDHLMMGDGALLASTLIPAFLRNPSGNSLGGPNAILVRLRPGGHADSLQTIADKTSTSADSGVSVLGVQRPAEIVNYRTMGSTPALLGAALAAGSAGALGLTLIASVRRRRRDLAVLKALGSTRRQLAAVVAWQASVAVAIGTAVGIPLGVALGRSLWDLFAAQVHVVPEPAVTALSILGIGGGALALANAVAAVPARVAARTRPATTLRSE